MNDNNGDVGWAAKVNGILLLRTATDTPWQAMGNTLCLVFGYQPPTHSVWDREEIESLFRSECLMADEIVEIVRCRAVEIEDDQPNMGHGDHRIGQASSSEGHSTATHN